ncbi:DNA-3-methyladenine glycosylase I [Tessaracoccus sp.]
MTRNRCFGTGDPLYEQYHDEEWGHPVEDVPDERELFERVALEGFQAGLSWITVLRKREAFRKAFKGFVPAKVAQFTDADVDKLMANESIIRNRAKITATIGNARALLSMHQQGIRLDHLMSEHSPPPSEPGVHSPAAPGSTPESLALSKRLKGLGFRFVGPTTMQATMQALGIADGHAPDCWLAEPSEHMLAVSDNVSAAN